MLVSMSTELPSAEEVAARLRTLRAAQMRRLEALSGVPMPTLVKIRYRQTLSPELDTVRRFWPHIDAAAAEPAGAEQNAG